MDPVFKYARKHEMLLTVLIILYIVLNVPTPHSIAPYIDTPLGNIVVAVIALSLFTHSHAVVGVLGLFAAYVLIRRSGSLNQFPVTLEEQMVALRAPLADAAVGSATSSFHPNHLDQTSLGYTQV